MVSKEILTRLPETSLRSVSHCILPPTRPILATAAKRWKSGQCKRNKSDLQKSKSDSQKEQIRLAKEQIRLAKGANPTCKRSKSDLQKSKSGLQKEQIRLAKGANQGSQKEQIWLAEGKNPTCKCWKSGLAATMQAVPEQSTRAVAIHTFHSGELLRSARQKLSFCHRSCRHILFVAEKREFVNSFNRLSLYIPILEVFFRHCITSTILS